MQESFVINQETGRLSVNESRARAAVFRLAATIMDIQERGDFAAAQNFVNRFGVSSPEIEELIKKVDDFPIDIRIRYLSWDS
jgi:hypothetical protein